MSTHSDFETFLSRSLDHLLENCPANLVSSIRYSLLAPGKRIRPRFVLATSEMLKAPTPAALAAAGAIEMVHCFTLIHDDLPCMDNDDFRRGKPSNHKVYGEATALLAGDALMPLAIDLLLSPECISSTKASEITAALRILSTAMGARGVIGGQAAEPELTSESRFEALERMFLLKTGALFEASILMPAALAGIKADSPEWKDLAQFAREIGYAFQVVDDLEDAVPGQSAPLTSILAHQTPEKAKSETKARLRKSMNQIQSRWGSQAQALLKIASEVESKL